MKIIFGTLIMLLMSSISFAQSVVINSSDYKLRIHSSDHPADWAKNTVVLLRKDEQMNDNQTFYFSLDSDPFIYASLSDVLKTKPHIRIWYDKNKVFPWGSFIYYITVVEGLD